MSDNTQIIELTESFTPTGDIIQDTRRAETYATLINMDENNKKAAVVIATQGLEAGMNYMISGGVEGQQLSYAEMRARYG